MRILIASDIHGSSHWCEKALTEYSNSGSDRLLLLGDILYHGPRNGLPYGHDPKGVIDMLNPLKDEITCVRGNCEAEVDQMVLDFPVMADYEIIKDGERVIFATHGHLWNMDNPPELPQGALFLNGHFHVPEFRDKGSYFYANPGSVSLPKYGSRNSVMLYDDGRLSWIDIAAGKIYRDEILT